MPDSLPPDKEASDRFRKLLSSSEEEEQSLWDEIETSQSSGESMPDEPDADLPVARPGIDTLPMEDLPPSRQEPPAEPARPSLDEEDTQPIPTRSNPTPQPPPPQRTPRRAPPAVDTRGMALPRRVDEIDVDATRVSPVAYRQQQPGRRPRPVVQSPPPPPPQGRPQYAPPPPPPPATGRRAIGCFVRLFVASLFLLVLSVLCGASFVVFQYLQIRSSLPDVDSAARKSVSV